MQSLVPLYIAGEQRAAVGCFTVSAPFCFSVRPRRSRVTDLCRRQQGLSGRQQCMGTRGSCSPAVRRSRACALLLTKLVLFAAGHM